MSKGRPVLELGNAISRPVGLFYGRGEVRSERASRGKNPIWKDARRNIGSVSVIRVNRSTTMETYLITELLLV